MTTRAKWLVGAAGVVAALAVFAWVNRIELMLTAVEIASDWRMPVGPNRPVTWDAGPDPAGRPPAERPPNVVLILADDLGWNDLTWNGGGVAGGTVPTPNIDSIAAEGASFPSGYAANATCAPSRAAILSGRYATRFGFEFTPTPPGMSGIVGVLANSMPGRIRPVLPSRTAGREIRFEDMAMPSSEITIAELLKQADYHTVHIGKWHLGRSPGSTPNDQGFDESLLMHSGLYLPEDDPGVVNSKQDFDPIDQFLWRALKYAASFDMGEPFEPAGYLTDYYTDEAVRVIEANRDRPFFLYLAHWAPHTPLQARREDYDALAHIEDHRLRVYAAMIRALDRGVGRVLDALRENGLEENTLVFFTSDNGAPSYIGLPDVNAPFRGWKLTNFEGGIHVPFFVKWPARIPAGATSTVPVHHFDVYATTAAAAGVPVPSDRVIDGLDLVPYATGEETEPLRDALFWRSGHYRAALADGWKLQKAEMPHKTWLYDLGNDPTEQENLAEIQIQRRAYLERLMDAHDAAQRDPLWPSRGELPVNVDKTLAEPDAPDDEFVYWPN